MLLLNQLQVGQTAKIKAIHADKQLYQRLNALGFRLGKLLHIMRIAGFGGPIQVRLASTDVMIRQQDAVCIEIAANSVISPLCLND